MSVQSLSKLSEIRTECEMYNIALISVLVLVVGSVGADKRVSFENYKVFSLDVSTKHQLDALHQLHDSDVGGISFWKSPSIVGQQSDIMVAPHQLAMFSELLQKYDFENHVMVDNVQR